MDVDFAEGELIHTENSYKYDLEGIAKLAAETGSSAGAHGSTNRSDSAVIYCWQQADKTTPGVPAGNSIPLMADANEKILVEFRDVSYSVPALPSPIISHLNLSVRNGETLVLLGESGCGKTTTLKLVNRLLLPTSGTVLVEGKTTIEWTRFVCDDALVM